VILRKLYYALSSRQRLLARRLTYAPLDLLDALLGRRDPLTPPRGFIYTGPGDFRKEALRYVGLFRSLGGLQPHHRVLDVGSGIGRMAVPLLDYLDAQGSYEGFDIVQLGVDWCTRHLTARNARFRFVHADIHNSLYNDTGKIRGGEFRFPYPDASFDFVFLTSVFTHMLPEETAHYAREIGRVLRPGGTCFATYFLLDADTIRTLDAGGHPFAFPYERDRHRLMSEDADTANVAFDAELVAEMWRDAGMEIRATHLGWWRNETTRAQAQAYQDVVIARKPRQ